MSESQEPGRAGGYQRSPGGLLAAMVVTVLAVIAFVAVRGLTSDTRPTPVRSVDYLVTVHAARAAKQLLVPAPARLPAGWTATSVGYTDGAAPTWHLGTLTGKRKYVGIEESRASIDDLVRDHVDKDAIRGQDVTVAHQSWQTWTDAGGDYALARSLRRGGRTVESWLVVGTAPAPQIRDYASTLTYGPPPGTGPSPGSGPTG